MSTVWANALFAWRMLYGCLTVGCFLVISQFFFCMCEYFGASCQQIAPATIELQCKCWRPQMFKVCFYSYRRLYTNLSEVSFFRFCVTCVQKTACLRAELLEKFQQQDHVSKKNNAAGIAPYISWVLHSWCGSRCSPRLTTNSTGALFAVLTELYINRAFMFCVGV